MSRRFKIRYSHLPKFGNELNNNRMPIQITDLQNANDFAELLASKIAEATPQPEPVMERFVSKKTLSEMLEISFSSIERLIRDGTLRSYRVRGRIRFKYSEIVQMVNKGFIDFENPIA